MMIAKRSLAIAHNALLPWIIACGCAAMADEPRIALEVTAHKAEDRAVVRTTGDHATIEVSSPSGIGGATLRRKGERWPTTLIVKLGLHGLEQFRVEDGESTLTVMVSSGGDRRTTVTLREKGEEEIRVDRDGAYWAEVRFVDGQGRPTRANHERDGTIDISLPQQFYSRNRPAVTLKWVDFFR
jgi:hypothetical protein